MSKELPIEYCCECDEPTGCAGRADDSHYNEDGKGPFCWKCWCIDENPRLHEQIEQLRGENRQLKGEEPIPEAWWKDCPKLAQKTMERVIAKNERLKGFLEDWDGHSPDCGRNRDGFEGHDETMFNCDCGYEDAKAQALKGE